MINPTIVPKKSFSKNKHNLIEKYIASKCIKKYSRPSQLNLQQRMLFTQTTPNQNYSYLNFKNNHCQRPFDARNRQTKFSDRQANGIFLKEDLIKLGKINEDRNERKVTKISLLLKKLVSQQRQCDKYRIQVEGQSIIQSRSSNAIKNKSINDRGQQKIDSFRSKPNLNLKQIQQSLISFKNQIEHQHSVHKILTARNNHMRYASTASKLKANFKAVQNACLQTLKIHRCTKTKLSWQLEQKDYQDPINQRSVCQQKSPRDQLRVQLKVNENLARKRSQRYLKVPKMPTLAKSESHNQTIQPWTHHQIALNDQIDIQE